MGDGRQQDGNIPEDLRRQDGAGRREPLPQSEAARGNVKPHVKGPAPERAEHTVTTPEGGHFEVLEDSGIAAAETRSDTEGS